MWQCTPANAGQVLNKYSVVVLLRQAVEQCLEKKDVIPNGFRRAGIVPWNREAPDTSKLLPGTIFQPSQVEVQSNSSSILPSQLDGEIDALLQQSQQGGVSGGDRDHPS